MGFGRKTSSVRKKAAPPVRKTSASKDVAKEISPLDLSAFPAESVVKAEKWICLACVLDVFLRHLKLAARTAYLEVKRYSPTVAELSSPSLPRPYFVPGSEKDPCPYCGSAPKWHAHLRIYRIESGKATDALRRKLVGSLSGSEEEFAILEEKATRREAFFEWLEKTSEGLDFDDPVWLRDASIHYLSRKEPKVDWKKQFEGTHTMRRSRRLEEGWEVEAGRMFLAPMLFDELLLVQYLLSRSHKAGGLTVEGRYTLQELFVRLRNSGYLRTVGVDANNPSDAIETLLEYLSGGETAVKFHFIVDRRDFLAKAKSVRLLRPPKPKKPAATRSARPRSGSTAKRG